jgi:hypothetical protein
LLEDFSRCSEYNPRTSRCSVAAELPKPVWGGSAPGPGSVTARFRRVELPDPIPNANPDAWPNANANADANADADADADADANPNAWPWEPPASA